LVFIGAASPTVAKDQERNEKPLMKKPPEALLAFSQPSA
jgi:hypothetical protein